MWPFSSSAKLAKRKFEDATYAQAEREMADDRMPPGIRARAYAEAQGDEQKARALSVRLRAEDIALEAKAQGEAQFLREMDDRRLANAAKREAEAKAQQSPKNGGGALTVVVIVGAVMILAYFHNSPMQESSTNTGVADSKPRSTQTPAQQLQEALSAYVRETARKGPYTLPGEQQFIIVSASQSGLYVIHQVRIGKTRASDIRGDFLKKAGQAFARQNCKRADFRAAFSQGAVFRYEIVSADSVAIGAVDVSKSSCGA
jgi:hypothetical protein